LKESAGAARLARRVVLLGTPLALVLLEFFHARNLEPTVYQALSLGVNRWLVVHVAQLILFGLMGLAIYLLVEGLRGPGAAICRVSAGVFVLFYGAMVPPGRVLQGPAVPAGRGVVEMLYIEG
jgi:hypothetical protein